MANCWKFKHEIWSAQVTKGKNISKVFTVDIYKVPYPREAPSMFEHLENLLPYYTDSH